MSEKAFPYLTSEQTAIAKDSLRSRYADVREGELYAPKMIELFRKYLGKSKNVIDLGSANGRIFEVLHEIGVPNTYGTDIQDYLTKARPSQKFETADFNNGRLPFEDGTFDGATNIEVIEHLENPYHFLREAARVLAPGGIFIITTPNPDHLFNKLSFLIRGKFYRFLDGNNHIMLFAHYLLSKGAMPYFELVKTEYLFGQFPYRMFSKMRFPENKLFGRTAVYILKRK